MSQSREKWTSVLNRLSETIVWLIGRQEGLKMKKRVYNFLFIPSGALRRETSIKIVEGGTNLTLSVKKIQLNGEALDEGQVQSVCSEIGKRYKIPAVPFNQNKGQEILIPAFCNLPQRTIPVNEWLITPSTN